MSVALHLGNTIINVVCVCGPKVGHEDEKLAFSEKLDLKPAAIPAKEMLPVEIGLNRHLEGKGYS